MSKKLYTFDKSVFKSPREIKNLYRKKIEALKSNQEQGQDLSLKMREAYIYGDEFGSYLRLTRAAKLDPRYPSTKFTSKEAAEQAKEMAEKLDEMDEKEFIASGYPFVWLDELGANNIIDAKSETVFSSEDNRKRAVLLFLVIGVFVALALLIYLKNYRIKYCQTKYPTFKSTYLLREREKCLDRPLDEFIFNF